MFSVWTVYIRTYVHRFLFPFAVYLLDVHQYHLTCVATSVWVAVSPLPVHCITDATVDANACRTFTSEEKTTAQVKAEIDRCLREKSSIESSFPAGVVVGPFHVVVEGLRLQLARKCRELATALLEFMVKKLREESAEICDQFMEISRKLFEKPNSIEVCVYVRTYTTPFSSHAHTHTTKQTLQHNSALLTEKVTYVLAPPPPVLKPHSSSPPPPPLART